MDITLQSHLTLYPLSIREDKKHYIVEEPVSGDFFEMPAVSVDAIHLINRGEPLDNIERELQATYPDEDVALIPFVEQLVDLGLVKEVDGETVPLTKQEPLPSGFTWLAASVGRFFFNRFTMKLYIVIVLVNLWLMFMNPQLVPAYQDLFLFDAMTLNMLLYMGISLLLVLMHEFAHILAVRSYDLPATLDVGRRLFLVVFETDLTCAWKLAPQQRNRLYLAGICFEQVMVLIALVIQLAVSGSTLVSGIFALVVLDIFIKTIYQCCFYMKTDLYYLFENMTGSYNLMENSQQYLRKWIPFMKQDSTTEAFAGEATTIRLYALFYSIGLLLTFGVFLFYFIPQAVYAYAETLPELLDPVGNPLFWDAAVFVGQTVLLGGLYIYAWRKPRAS
ncbi:hypothetical protein GCM10008983_00530 [Lentibacillus halophilus]|uniref:Peptide zinc metalloprotease protein n=1 Tax=Lentibacillus halophilus TaxID=295065 RepID=A0ABP3IX46_9BACI